MDQTYNCSFDYGTVLTADEWLLFREQVTDQLSVDPEEDGTVKLSTWNHFDVIPSHIKSLFPHKKIIVGESIPANHAYLKDHG